MFVLNQIVLGGGNITTLNAFNKRTECNFIGAAIAAGASLAGGLLAKKSQSDANATNLKIARETNAANQQLAQQQNQWNLDQWNRENEYNSASSQRQRLQAAGYNPALAVGQVATGSAISNQLQSAPYTPNNQVQVQPVNYGRLS